MHLGIMQLPAQVLMQPMPARIGILPLRHINTASAGAPKGGGCNVNPGFPACLVLEH